MYTLDSLRCYMTNIVLFFVTVENEMVGKRKYYQHQGQRRQGLCR